MKILHDLPLADYSTMRLGGTAAHVAEITSKVELVEALAWAKARSLPVIMIGGGSNIFWQDEGFSGLLVINQIMGYEDSASRGGEHILTVGAGENWDSVVERSVAAGLTGIEALSLVPGSAGATPIQNVGAYGQEIAQALVSLEAYDWQAGDFVTLPGSECGFSYRNSRFKTGPDRGRFFITSLILRLVEASPKPPFYPSVQNYFDANNLREITPAQLRQAVVDIRRAKLPDPALVSNCGSFFANPIISQEHFDELNASYPGIPSWPTSDGKVKIPAAWLIEQVGLKDFHDAATGMATWPAQPLVLVNEKARSTADLLAFKQQIVAAVEAKFHVTLTQEPELLP